MDVKLITSIATSVIPMAKELGVTHSHPHVFTSLFEKIFDHKVQEYKEKERAKEQEAADKQQKKAERPIQIVTQGAVTVKEVIKKETSK